MSKSFIETNVNPQGKNTTDCQTRAISMFLGVTYKEALFLLVHGQLETGYFINTVKTIDYCLEKIGCEKHTLTSRMTVNQLTKVLNQRAYVRIKGHGVCATSGKFFDTWDCGRRQVIEYFTISDENRIKIQNILKTY